MRWFYYGLGLLLIIPLQAVGLEAIEINAIKPDLAFIMVFITGWTRGMLEGLLLGAGLGGLLDFFLVGVLGVNFVLGTVTGAIAGALGTSVSGRSIIIPCAMFVAMAFLNDLSGNIFLAGIGQSLAPMKLMEYLLRAIYSSAFTAILWILGWVISKPFYRRKLRVERVRN